MYIYYPSCNFQRLFPETAARIRAFLEGQDDVKIAGCCHRTHDIPRIGDTIVTICTSCMRLFDETRPDIPNISLFELLLNRADFPWPDRSGTVLMLQDCFRAHGKRRLQDAARQCLKKMHVDVVEMEPSRDDADFDGPFLLRDAPERNKREAPRYFAEYLPAHLTLLPEEQWKPVFEARASQFKGSAACVYCNTCHMGLKEGGANVRHLAELIFK